MNVEYRQYFFDLRGRILSGQISMDDAEKEAEPKMREMTVKGGMTDHYQKNLDGGEGKEHDGRWRMAEELRKKHPDVTTIVWKWGRWQHQVDYSPFRHNKLILKPDVVVPKGVDNYGMRLKFLSEESSLQNRVAEVK